MSSSRTTTRNRRDGSTGRSAARNSGMFPIGSITKNSRIAADVSVMDPIVPEPPAATPQPGRKSLEKRHVRHPLVRVATGTEAKHDRRTNQRT